MYLLGIFLVELALLFSLSQSLTKALSVWFHALLKSQTMVIQLLALLFLPGVIVHELSHLLTASILFVPTGEIEFLPEIHGDEVKMGSVSIAKTDPFRRFLIGVAPLLVGLGTLVLLFWYFLPTMTLFSWQTALLVYAVFEVSNTMFSSRKDMEGAIGLLILCLLAVVLLMAFHGDVVGIVTTWVSQPFVQALLFWMGLCLGVAIGIDVVVLALTKGFLSLHTHH